MIYNSKLENNTTSLQAILETVNNLPEANAAPRKVTVHFLNVYDDSSFQLWYFDESFNLMKATSNTTVTTMAGIISFIANIILALVLVIFLKGNGIALALSLASLVNTIFLFIFMKKMNSFNTKIITKKTLLYIVKIIILSVVAAIPCYLLNPIWISAFENYGKMISQGMPILINFLIFATIGVIELILTKDEIALVILRKIKRR